MITTFSRRQVLAAAGIAVIAATAPAIAEAPQLAPINIPYISLGDDQNGISLCPGESLSVAPTDGHWFAIESADGWHFSCGTPMTIQAGARGSVLSQATIKDALCEHIRGLLGTDRPVVMGESVSVDDMAALAAMFPVRWPA